MGYSNPFAGKSGGGGGVFAGFGDRYRADQEARNNYVPPQDNKKSFNLEQVLMGIAQQSSPTLNTSYRPGSLPSNNSQNADLSKWENLAPALRTGAGQLLQDVVIEPVANLVFNPTGGHTAGEYTEADLRKMGVDKQQAKDAGMKQVAPGVYVDRFNRPYDNIREPLASGLQASLMRLGGGNGFVRNSLESGLGNLGGSYVNAAMNPYGEVEDKTVAAPGNFGERLKTANDNALGNFAFGAALGGITGGKSKGGYGASELIDDLTAPKQVKNLIKKQNTLEGVLGVINDADISVKAKRQLQSEVTSLNDTLSLPAGRTRVEPTQGTGFTMADNSNPAIIAAGKELNSINKKLDRVSTGKVSVTRQEATNLLDRKQQLIEQINTGNFEQAPSRTSPTQTTISTRQKTTGAIGTETPMQPVGMGKTRTSELGRSTAQKAVDQKLTDTVGDLPEYQQVRMADQAAASVDLLAKDEARAIKIAMGKEEPPPGLIPESVYTAVENKALQDGNAQLLNDLAHSSRVTEATAMGQRIRALGERDPDSAVAAIRAVSEARKEAMLSKGKAAVAEVKKTVDDIKAATKVPTRQDWDSFIESIKC